MSVSIEHIKLRRTFLDPVVKVVVSFGGGDFPELEREYATSFVEGRLPRRPTVATEFAAAGIGVEALSVTAAGA